MTAKQPRTSGSATTLHGRDFINSLLITPSDQTDWLTDLRSQARARLEELSIPTPRDEDWKYTDLSELIQYRFQPASQISISTLQERIQPLIWPETQQSCLVFMNGIYIPDLSSRAAIPDSVTLAPLSQTSSSQIQPYLQRIGGDDVFTTLNTACLQEAAALVIPRNTEVQTPIQLLFLSLPDPETPRIAQPRALVIAGSGSSATVVEDHIGLDPAATHFTNGVMEIELEANAQITHLRQQREGAQTFHIAKTAIRQARDSQYTHHAISWGAKLSRHTLELAQTEPSASTILNGLTLATNQQLADTHTTVDHQVPHGCSQQLHKLILTDAAHGVFNGKLRVRQAAQLTHASQSSRNLLLSPKARVDTKPQLEIFADDVKCAHGATVSQLEEDEVFYLRSRGIDADQARALLTYGFAAEIIDLLPLTALRDHLRRQILTFTQVP